MFKGKTILVVDDNLVNRKMLSAMMRTSGFKVLQAENGQEALELLSSPQQQIDLILLDIVMPIMDGHQLLAKMSELNLINKVPVIVLTSSGQEETEITCLQEGASDFLKKPYNKALVKHRVESILRLWDNAILVSKLEIDRLTGVYNLDSFYRHANEILAKKPDGKWELIYVTVEDFKFIKERYGDEMSEKIIRFMANLVKEMAANNGICGTLGQADFVALHKNFKGMTQAELGDFYAEKLKDAPRLNLSLKCGICTVTDFAEPIEELCEKAKVAEHSIKHKYGVFYALYDQSMLDMAVREHQLTNFMEEALAQQQFVVYLQPKHSTVTGKVVGAEALVRWMHPELGFISPGEFIPLFERNGFIAKVDAFVWEEACRILRSWIDAGITPVPISVNASRVDFYAHNLPEQVNALVQKYDLTPNLLHIEVTESAYTDQPQQLIDSICLLRKMGFKIEMDDFGSGYSSLNMLSELPIDILKLDMRFMQQGVNRLKGNKRNILSFIVSLSKWLQLATVAEGVETKEEFELLKSMGCDYIQGYFFSKPIPSANFAEYMRNYKNVFKTTETPHEDHAHLDAALPGKKRSLLVVDDIENNREIMKALLADDYEVAMAEDGQVAYEYIKAHCSDLSCILLDLLMPVMDGFTLLEKLQQDTLLAHIPVIITTEAGGDDELRALNLGAYSFVAKPYNKDVLRHHIRKAIEEKELVELNQKYKEELAKLKA